ncbi:MAG: DUF4347 domain-containing protein, partial [Methylococcales bacterium]|nr:DUF4347 domain-containing protein [Methylococcales bacterium]
MTQTNTAIQNLLVIDNQVADWQSLISGIGADTAVLVLDSGSDGLTQISDYLASLAGQNLPLLQSIQIISHGDAGALQLGSDLINQSNLSSYAKQLSKMGSSLTATGDILLYGCNVAAGQTGLDFISQFAALTNADVAASNDITGSAALNGNWQLEVKTGVIDADIVIMSSNLSIYNAILAISDFILPGSSQTGTSGSDSFEVLSGSGLTVDGGDGLDTLKIEISGSVEISYDSSTHIRTLSGIDSSVTGTFQSFENVAIQAGTGNDNINLISTQDFNPLYISGGIGTDSITLPNNGVSSVIYSINEMIRPDLSIVLQVSAQA